MYSDTIDHFANLARNKADTLLHRPLAFLTGARTACARHPAQLAGVPAPLDGGADTKRRHQGDCCLLVPVHGPWLLAREPWPPASGRRRARSRCLLETQTTVNR